MSVIAELRKLADKADAEAARLAALNAASGLDREEVLAKQAFYTGQASGFRQAAYFAEMEARA